MSKVVPLESLRRFVAPGSTVALGGAWMSNHPMAAVRQLIRDGVGELHVVDSLASIDVDLLVGAGLVRELTFSMVSLEAFGLAPHFRRAVEDGTLRINEVSGVAMNVAMDAGARNVPFLPMGDLGSSALPERVPHILRRVDCPFTGESLLAVRAFHPDVALLHVLRADAEGNCQVDGPLAIDPEIARASRSAVVTCEQLVTSDEIASSAATTHIPGFLVDAVIEAPFGAHPTTHVPRYGFDAWEIMAYADTCADGKGAAYVQQLRSESEDEYRARVLDPQRRAVLASVADRAHTLEEDAA